MAARAAKRNSDERKTELKNAQTHRRATIDRWNHCNLDQRRRSDHGQRVLRQLVTIEKVDRALPHELLETLERICATRTPAFKTCGPGAKRQGAKAVKKLERAANAFHIVNSEEATLYRARSARANFLSQDRVDIHFSTKELCRDFSQPTQKSFLRLKRLVRYLIGVPKLVYNFPFVNKRAKPAEHIDLFVDTDVAGCRETRRSNSGGVAMIGGGNVKHWRKTQTTIALSSGEAELSGIGQGIAQGP